MKTQTQTKDWDYQPLAGNHDFAVYDAETGKDVALVRGFNLENAKLISAAPELLEELKTIVQIICESDRDVTIEDCDPAKEAIRKATE